MPIGIFETGAITSKAVDDLNKFRNPHVLD
jgi:hypothetical protein